MTLHVPIHLEQKLKDASVVHGKTEQQMLEELLAQALSVVKPRRSWVGLGASGIGDLSERIDELLFADRVPERST